MATQLIPVFTAEIGNSPVNAIDARVLHTFLEVGTQFKDWIVRRINEYDFKENLDFCSFLSESTGGRPSKEYHCTISMGKELAMVERNEKGKQARQYFIECERQLLAPSEGSTEIDNLLAQHAMIGKALIEMKRQREAITVIQQDVSDIKAALPTVKTHTTVRAFAATHNLRLHPRVAQRMGKRCAHITINQGLAIHAVPDDLYGTVNAYPNAVIQRVFAEEFAQEEVA